MNKNTLTDVTIAIDIVINPEVLANISLESQDLPF